MIQKDGSILINEWNKIGISSPYFGFQEIRNINLNNDGCISINNKPQNTTSALANPVLSKIISVSADSANDKIYGIDDSNKLYRFDLGQLTAYSQAGARAGIAVFKNYLIIVRATGAIDYYGPLNSPSVTTGWQTIGSSPTSVKTVPMLWADNDILYIGTGNYVASIQAIGTFDPSNSATYLVSSQALDIPSRYRIVSMVSMGTRLMIGATDGTETLIFPWDMASPSFDLPIKISEPSLEYMIVHAGRLYIMAGGRGKWYISDGINIQDFAILPESFVNLSTGVFDTVSTGVSFFNDKIVFGLSGQGSGIDDTPVGVYGLNTNTGKITLEYTLSTDTHDYPLAIGSIIRYNNVLYVCWDDGTDAAIDNIQLSKSGYYDNYDAYFISPLYQVSDGNEKTYERLDVILGKKLISGSGIKIEYRKTLDDSWSTVDTITYTDDGALKKFVLPFGVTTTTLQLKVSLNQTIGRSLELISIRII